jgi:hypothetical protein
VSSSANSHSIEAIRLDSWKGISRYMGRSTRTVQRWHAELDLPVRHIGGVSTSVFAFSDELDRWLRTFINEQGAG